MKQYSDTEIVECLRSRQSYVVRYLSDAYLPMIRLMVKNMGGSGEDAKDIFQEGLMIVIQKTDDRNFSLNCRFKTYLYAVCRHLSEMMISKRILATNHSSRVFVEAEETDIEGKMDNETYQGIFREAFESLDEPGRSILKLYWEEMPPQEIADKLGYTYGYVRKKKCEAQAELIGRVKEHREYRMIERKEGVWA